MIAPSTTHEPITLTLTITDTECVAELMNRTEGGDREFFALSALRVGVLSLRQASGVIDRAGLRNEGDRLLESLHTALKSHYEKTTNDIGAVLEKYFDVNDGALLQRLDRLVKKDGELETILSRNVGADSPLSSTLDRHLGSKSPMMQTISIDRSKGLLAALNEVLEDSVKSHNQTITSEFTLDNKDSALSRLVTKITDENGQLRKEFSADIDALRKEFSLDNESGALSRLVGQVERSRRAIVAEFSPENDNSILSKIGRLLESTNESIRGSLTLDDETSPLSRLKRELISAVGEMEKKNTEFQSEVRETLAALTAKRSEAKRSTRHGDEFHDEVGAFIENEAQRLNDVCELTGNFPGAIPRCKKGDVVVSLGPESSAPGVNVVFEAKNDKSYTLKKALDELSIARENRKSECGVFVFARDAAPEGLEPISRFGHDIVVIWDSEDPLSDVNLKAAYSIARCIAVDKSNEDKTKTGEIVAIENAVKAVARSIEVLSSIQTMATTVKNNGEKIVKKAAKLQSDVSEQLELIDQHVGNLEGNPTRQSN